MNAPRIISLSRIDPEDPQLWLSRAEDAIDFLKENAQSREIVIFATLPHVFLQGILVPIDRLDPPDQEDLLGALVFSDDTWAIEHVSGGGEEDWVRLSPPLSNPGCRTLVGGEQLVFRRSFDGLPAKGTYTEVNQKLVHAFGLHFLEERGAGGAFCRLDRRGDIEDVIRIVNVPKSSRACYGGSVVTILAKEFITYMALTKTALVVRFDFTRFKLGEFSSWPDHPSEMKQARDLFYNVGVVDGHASYVKGCQIVYSAISIKDIFEERKRAVDGLDRKYESFEAVDLKTGRIIETSCSPNCLSNYFQPDSPLPNGMSPAFFRAEVPSKYNADKEKYSTENRSISCRGAWHIRSYDINEEGQVHVYLKDLASLPYEEQSYWKSFNEEAKGLISKRAWKTDFEGDWDESYDPLDSIKSRVRSLDQRSPDWWNQRGEELISAVHYPVTTSPDEWANEILALDQLIVEGFRDKELKNIAKSLKRLVDNKWGSLKVVEECFVGAGMSADEAKSSVEALRRLHKLRTEVKGHAAVSARNEHVKQARKNSGSLRAHFEELAGSCDASFTSVVNVLEAQA